MVKLRKWLFEKSRWLYPRLLKWLYFGSGLALITMAAGVIVSIWVPLTILGPLISVPSSGGSTPSVTILITFAGVLVALAGQLLNQGRNVSESLEKRSQFYLDSCIKAYEEAQNLLLDGNNHRTTWIAAGRALKHAKALSNDVSFSAHRRVLEIHQLKYRRFFYDLLKKPAVFFYGATDILITTEEAAKLSRALDEDEKTFYPIRELSEGSIQAVWEAAQFPQSYQDPLAKAFSETEKGSIGLFYEGLREYLEHTAMWRSAGGKLYPEELRTKPGSIS